MSIKDSISFRNVTRRPARTAGLALIAALLAFAVCAGTMVVAGLTGGLDSLDERLGADIMVVPFKATTSTDFSLENMVLTGATGYFYMDQADVDEIEASEGIERASTQFFLASTSASCCSTKVQIIGFDPKTDFTIQPWIKSSNITGQIGDLQVIVGSDLTSFVGDTIRFYGTDVSVVGKLATTGTALDTAVYTSNDTVKTLIRSAAEQGFYDFNFDPDTVASCVLIDVADDVVTEEVANDINIHVQGVEAVQTKGMTADVADSLSGISGVVRLLVVVVWVLAIILMIVAFKMIANERRREFAVLRVVGASRTMLARIVLGEAALTSLIGAVCGIVFGMAIVFGFSHLIESQLALPYLMPSVSNTALIALVSLVATVVVGSLAASGQAAALSRRDVGLDLRGDI